MLCFSRRSVTQQEPEQDDLWQEVWSSEAGPSNHTKFICVHGRVGVVPVVLSAFDRPRLWLGTVKLGGRMEEEGKGDSGAVRYRGGDGGGGGRGFSPRKRKAA